ncbi:hypothetical protein D3C86_1910650 [compost metagenome]
MMFDFRCFSAVSWVPQVMQHDKSVRACIAEIFLRTQDSRTAVIVLGKLYEAIKCTGTRTNRFLNLFAKRAHASCFVRDSSP